MRGGGGSGGTERKDIIEAEVIDTMHVVAGSGTDAIDGIRAAEWNSDPRVANVLSALPMRQILEPGADRWCIGQIACSPCAHVHSVAASSCASSTIDGAISSADCTTSQEAARTIRARRTLIIDFVDCSAHASRVSISAGLG